MPQASLKCLEDGFQVTNDRFIWESVSCRVNFGALGRYKQALCQVDLANVGCLESASCAVGLVCLGSVDGYNVR